MLFSIIMMSGINSKDLELNFKLRKVSEGSLEVFIPTEKKISMKMPVFYNPLMKLNRDVTILLLKQFPKMRLCDPLAGSGIRSIRFAKELEYESMTVNDISKSAVALIKKNMEHNDINSNIIDADNVVNVDEDIEVHNMDANLLLLESSGFDFIDLDVFGSPNFMLDSAVKRISRGGIIGVTATDTSALCGTYPKACARKYWAVPIRTEIMHEAGIRILIRKVQLIAAQYEKALTPIYCLSKDHYFRLFFRCEKGKSKVDKLLAQHMVCSFFGSQDEFGPLWTGKLWDTELADKMMKNNHEPKNQNLLRIIADESKIESIFFYDLHKISKREKLSYNPRKRDVIEKLKNAGFKASETHFRGAGIRSNIGYDRLLKLLRKK